MNVAVLQFPGSNCDQDALHGLRELGLHAKYVWHQDTSLEGFDACFVPGGFSYGDYLRCGAMAARSPIMQSVVAGAEHGMPIIGVCNGFQILCEAGLLPGALLLNAGEKFICQDIYLKAFNTSSMWTQECSGTMRIPIAHGEGRYLCDEDTLKELQDSDRIAFRYVDASGEITPDANPNGSLDNIAGILNRRGNVLGMMPHPERAVHAHLGNCHGHKILNALKALGV